MTRNLIKAGCFLLTIWIALACTAGDVGVLAQSRARRPIRSAPKPLTAAETREARQRLADMGYWMSDSNRFDESSRQALIAFQKVEGRSLTGRLTREEFQAIQDAQRPTPYETGAAHIEVDLSRQVLFVVDDQGKVFRILPVSSASGKTFDYQNEENVAVTPRGRFTVYKKLPGWHKSELGLLYYPSYIVGGIAIHGNPSVPAFPASHGCIRIPMFAAKDFSDTTPIGTRVIVFAAAAN